MVLPSKYRLFPKIYATNSNIPVLCGRVHTKLAGCSACSSRYIYIYSVYIISHISPQTSHRHKVQPLNSIFTPQVWAISCHFCPLPRSRSAPRMPRCWSSAAFRSSGGDLQRWSIITGWWFQPGLYLYSHIMSHIIAGCFFSHGKSIYIYIYIYYICIYTHGWWFQPTPLKNDGLSSSVRMMTFPTVSGK